MTEQAKPDDRRGVLSHLATNDSDIDFTRRRDACCELNTCDESTGEARLPMSQSTYDRCFNRGLSFI